MSSSKRSFEEWAQGFCDFGDMDRPFNGHHHYPTTHQLRKLYSLNVEPTFDNAIALGKYNDREWRCLQIGTVEHKVGIHISTCRSCYDGETCILESEGDD